MQKPLLTLQLTLWFATASNRSKTEVRPLGAVKMWGYEKQNTKIEDPEPDSTLDFGNSSPCYSLH